MKKVIVIVCILALAYLLLGCGDPGDEWRTWQENALKKQREDIETLPPTPTGEEKE